MSSQLQQTQSKLRESLWYNRAFVWVISGNVISVFGDCFIGIALSLWILQTTGSAVYMSSILITYSVVSVCFGSLAGTVADRVNRRTLMIYSDITRGLIAFALMICVWTNFTSMFLIIALVAISAFASLFHGPAFHASLIMIVGKSRVQQATGVVQLLDNIARISGLAAGGIVVAALGGYVAILFNAVAFLLSAICVLAGGYFPSPRTISEERNSFSQDFINGFKYIKQNPFARAVVIMNPLLLLFFMSSLMLVQVMAVKDWRVSPILFGLIEACIPLGYMVGAGFILSFNNRLRRRGWWICAGLLLIGPVFLLVSAMNTAVNAIPFILISGLLFAFCTMLIQIILRTEIDVKLQGRIYGTLGSLSSIAPPLGLAVSSVIADQYGASIVLAINGAGMIVIGIVVTMCMSNIRTYS